MTFDEWVKLVAAHNPAGLSDIWINAARSGWEAYHQYRASVGEPGARAKEIAEVLADLFAGKSIRSIVNGVAGTAAFMSPESKLAYATQIIERYATPSAVLEGVEGKAGLGEPGQSEWAKLADYRFSPGRKRDGDNG